MITKVVFPEEYEHLKVASLPSNPTAGVNYGGLGYNAAQMKAAFDALPLFIIEKLNRLINDIKEEPVYAISSEMKTGIDKAPYLSDIFAHITDGQLVSYLTLGDESVASAISKIRSDIDMMKADIDKIKAKPEVK